MNASMYVVNCKFVEMDDFFFFFNTPDAHSFVEVVFL